MKYISEFRDGGAVQDLVAAIRAVVTCPWTIMEICGGQTHSLVKNGILPSRSRTKNFTTTAASASLA
jgi:hydrogenase expression/formation protein HypD